MELTKQKEEKEKKVALQETPLVTREIQKIVLKAMCDTPTMSIEELTLSIKNKGKEVTVEEVTHVIRGISPTEKWHKASSFETLSVKLDYIWTLESQILFLLSTKQKENSLVELNQVRLKSGQPKVSKDLVRHLQSVLMVEGKSLSKFRKFEKEHSLTEDVDVNAKALWSIRLILSQIDLNSLSEVQKLPVLLADSFAERFPSLAGEVGKTLQRICERFVDRYFDRSLTSSELKSLVQKFQSAYDSYKKGSETTLSENKETVNQVKLINNSIEKLEEIKRIVAESHEGGFLSKLFSGSVKNREGVEKASDEVIEILQELVEANNSSASTTSENALLFQKLQADYDNVLLAKGQLEAELLEYKEKSESLELKNKELMNECQDATTSLEKAHEKIADLQQNVDKLSTSEENSSKLKEEFKLSKNMTVKLYKRINRLKQDLENQARDLPKKDVDSSSIKSETVHKFQKKEDSE